MSWLPKKCVVVPFNFSDRSAQSLKLAPRFVAEIAHLHVVHVLSENPFVEHGMAWEAKDRDTRQQHTESVFRDRFATGPLNKVNFTVRFGDPGSQIVQFAEQLKAELILMHSHGPTGISRFFTRSVAGRVARLAHCPVLILKPGVVENELRPSGAIDAKSHQLRAVENLPTLE